MEADVDGYIVIQEVAVVVVVTVLVTVTVGDGGSGVKLGGNGEDGGNVNEADGDDGLNGAA